MSHEIIKGAALGLGAGVIAYGAAICADAIFTQKSINTAVERLGELPLCESGVLPVRIDESGMKKAGSYDLTCGDSRMPLTIRAEDSSFVVDWEATRKHIGALANEGLFTNFPDGDEGENRLMGLGFSLAAGPSTGALAFHLYARKKK